MDLRKLFLSVQYEALNVEMEKKTGKYHVNHTNPFQNHMGHGGVGVDYNCCCLVISYLLKEGGRVLAVIKHTH